MGRTAEIDLESAHPTETERERQAREMAELDADEDGDLFKGLDEIRAGGAVSFMVWRIAPAEKEGFCREYSATTFSLQKLAKDYGAGTYRIRVKGPGGRFIPGGGTQKIAESPAEPDNESSGHHIEDVITQRELERERREEARREREREDRKFYLQLAVTTLAPALLQLFQPKKETSLAEMVGALASMKQLQPEVPKEPDQFGLISKVLELTDKIQERAGGNSTGSNWIDVLRDALGAAKPVLEGLAAKIPAMQVAVPMLGAPPMPAGPLAPASVVSTAGITPNSGAPLRTAPAAVSSAAVGSVDSNTVSVTGADPMMQHLPWLKGVLGQFVVHAARNSDPALYADWLVDNMPDGLTHSQARALLVRPDWFELVTMLEPGARPYVGWFTQMRDEVVAIFDEESGVQPQPSPFPTLESEQNGGHGEE